MYNCFFISNINGKKPRINIISVTTVVFSVGNTVFYTKNTYQTFVIKSFKRHLSTLIFISEKIRGILFILSSHHG